MRFDLVIFDCDGTLVDSEYLNNKVTADLLAEIGLPQYDVHYAMKFFTGMTFSDIAVTVLNETGVALPPDFKDRYVKGVNAVMPDMLKAVEGVADVLTHLKPSVRMCVASNGERQNVLRSLHHAGLSEFFPDEIVFTKNMVAKGKPAPDLFLLAAKTMGTEPANTLVVEDSVTGAKAGAAAGMTVLGFTATSHEPFQQGELLRQAGASHIVDAFRQIVDFVQIIEK